MLGDGSEALLIGPGRKYSEAHLPPRQVTSRVAEAFYWMGRYLARAYHQAYLLQVIETLETEELELRRTEALPPDVEQPPSAA